MSSSLSALCAVLLLSSACASGLSHARLSPDEPASDLERSDRAAFKHPRCDPRLSMLFPGLGAFCSGRTEEGALLLSLGGAELVTGLSVGLPDSFAKPGAQVALLAFTDLWTATALEAGLRAQRAHALSYVPPDTVPELLAAPFNPAALKSPWVWGGVLGTVSLAVAFARLVDGPFDAKNLGTRPVLFGKTLNSAVGYPAAAAIGAGLFSHVALAEEIAFRGLLQSSATRAWGETRGWALSSLVFGLFHATNIVFLDQSQRVDYLVKSVPIITLVGAYLGWAYQETGYGLQAPVAVHFWYDSLLSVVSFVLDPKSSPLAFSVAF